MIRTFCDGCNADVTPHVEVWGIQMSELKKGNNTLIMHFCSLCQKAILKSVETTIKLLATSDGKS